MTSRHPRSTERVREPGYTATEELSWNPHPGSAASEHTFFIMSSTLELSFSHLSLFNKINCFRQILCDGGNNMPQHTEGEPRVGATKNPFGP